MNFKIDNRFVISQLLKSVFGYIIGASIVLAISKTIDAFGFLCYSFAAGVVIYLIYFYPQEIVVNTEKIIFSKEGSNHRIEVKLNEITHIRTKKTFYNTLIFITRQKESYTLHPKDIENLVNLLQKYVK